MEGRKIAGIGSPQELATYLQIVSSNRMNGIFLIACEGRQYQLLFYDGRLIYAEPEPERRDEALLEFLIEAKIIKKDEKEDMLKEKKKRRVSLVTAVVDRKGEIERIRKAMYARTSEAIFEITQSPQVKFEFVERRKNEIGFNPKIFRPLNVENLTMEAVRISDELSTVPEEARNENAVPIVVEEVSEEEVERFRIPPEILKYINGSRTILEIAREMGLSKFEVMLYTGELMKRGYVDIEEVREVRPPKMVKKSAVGIILKNIASVVMLLGMILGSYYVKSQSRVNIVSFDYKQKQEVNIVKQMIKLKTALYAYKYIHGEYPSSLFLLAENGFVTNEDLTFPIKKLYYYQRIEGKGYELLP